MSDNKEGLANLSKQELENKIYQQNLDRLREEGGIEALLIFNLENFAFRYLETSTHKDIKCQHQEGDFWVCSIEEDIVQALKWDNKELKSKLIELCKEKPGAQSKEIRIQLKLGSKIIDSENVECYSEINWNYPSFEKVEGKYLELTEQVSFDDPIVLRNTHAAYLEKVAKIF